MPVIISGSQGTTTISGSGVAVSGSDGVVTYGSGSLEDLTVSGSLTVTGSLIVSGSNTITNYGAFTSNEAGGDFDFRVESSGEPNMLFVDGGANRVGIGTITPDHELTIVGNVSASSNVSASAFYGDGSNLSNAGTSIHLPWISGSTAAYEAQASGSAVISLNGYNFASGISASLGSQATTDGHSWGATTWNSPVSVSFAVTGSVTTGSYDVTLTNTDNQAHTLTDGILVAAASLQEIEIHEADDIENSVLMGFTDSGGEGNGLEGLTITGSPPELWNTRCHTVAEISYADHAYIEVTPTVMSGPNNDIHHWIFGFGYKDDYAAGTYGFEWMGWAVYCWAGGPIADRGAGGAQELANPTGPTDATKAWMDANRSLRIEIIDNTAYLKYSDDDWVTESTFHTFDNAVDIGGNSNLVAGFSMHNGENNNGIMENIKMYGRLEGIDNGH